METLSITYNPDFSDKWVLYLSPAAWRGAVETEYVDVPLAQLEHAGSLTDPDVTEGWKTTLAAGRPIPPSVVCRTEHGTYYVHDGNHRLQAMREVLGENAMARVLLVKPRKGYRFRRRHVEGYETYVLERGPLLTYAIPLLAAMAASVIAVVLAAKAPNGAQEPSFAVSVGIVLLCARFAGWTAGLIASALTALLTAFFILPPRNSLLVADPVHARELLIVGLIMLICSLAIGAPRLHFRRRS